MANELSLGNVLEGNAEQSGMSAESRAVLGALVEYMGREGKGSGQAPNGDMPFGELMELRALVGSNKKNKVTKELQNFLAPLEHQAYVRNVVQDNPLLGTIGAPFGAVGYNAAKATKLIKARSDANLVPDLKATMLGIISGLAGYKAKGE
jgi:hypothetical protein